ncbi:hypothetical protein D9758_006417 [Tetrapyrgos nigripes]|uniref:Uncharacterized protein n=1 Tax=Tetrapyrgos nigripes TaxID=182062 RepID=A0A8H5FZK3_9AGAR|nr:hypothetical protein D9758_006417 [Tetrapyrgos nigripes]
MSDAVTIVLDDRDINSFRIGSAYAGLNQTFGFHDWEALKTPVNWSASSFFNNTGTMLNGPVGNLHELDLGLQVSFFGFTPPETSKQEFLVQPSLDGAANQTKHYPGPSYQCQFYASSELLAVLPDGSQQHPDDFDMYFNDNEGLMVDYVLIQVSNLTDLRGQMILLDDSNPEIHWQGNWVEKTDYFLEAPDLLGGSIDVTSGFPQVQPHGNGTHTSMAEGDSFVFLFRGTSILVSGINPMLPGTELEMNFTIDSNSTQQVYLFDTSSDALKFTSGSPHFVYFSNDALEEGDHILTGTVTRTSGNVSAIIDYLTYKPSFATLMDKPVFSSPADPVSSTTMAPTSSGSSSTSAQASPEHVGEHGLNGGAIGGIVSVSVGSSGELHEAQDLCKDSLICVSIANITYPPLLTRSQQPSHSEPDPYTLRSPTDSHISPVSQKTRTIPPALSTMSREKRTELQRQRDELVRGVRDLETQSQAFAEGSEDGTIHNQRNLEAQISAIHQRMDLMTREMSRYMIPPAYESQ